MKKVVTVVGARPQFIKASVVSKSIQSFGRVREVIVHTGQHFDANMSDVFFNQLGIPEPDYQLSINGGGHGQMTGRMLIEIEKVMDLEKPDWLMVYGDTNSTLAGALAAVKKHIPVVHVEAGLRSFNMNMPEEVNRILTDRVSDILLCPTDAALTNLVSEGFPFVTGSGAKQRYYKVGDVMQDAAIFFSRQARLPVGFDGKDFILTTLHRAENTDDPNRLAAIVEALNFLHENVAQVVLPLHPRTRGQIALQGLELKVRIIEPVGYLEMIGLLKEASLVLTDSGGVQKEAFFFGKACVTMRDQTEWVELVQIGANVLVGAVKENIISAVKKNFGRTVDDKEQLYGGGLASEGISKLFTEA